ncbi:hypothetical protein ETAE_2756 [Edwardsiella piscicida]|uniref:Uncharacterized protein n=1 Tax=Edwardsiella piscicida TaxID=1263550 RepID=A0AAU8PS06_EDWPI|nr:hypothetical protein ETAE_2756 [Edwardsiella tarda EIB202]
MISIIKRQFLVHCITLCKENNFLIPLKTQQKNFINRLSCSKKP